MAPLADERAIQNAVTVEAARVVLAQLAAYSARTSIPTADDATAQDAVRGVVASEDVAALVARANKVAHAQVVAVLTGQDVLGLQTSGGLVAIDLATTLTAIATRFASPGYQIDFEAAFADAPASLTIFESTTLGSAQRAARLFDRVAIVVTPEG